MPFPKNEVRKVCMHDTRALLWERSHSRCFGYPSEILSSDLMVAGNTPQPSRRSTQRSSTWDSDARRGGTQSASFRDAAGSECAFSSTPTPRVRFSVECAFSDLRKCRVVSRKSAVCTGGLTERRILPPGLTERRTLHPRGLPECAFPLTPTPRVRFSVKCAFSDLRKRRVVSRKSAVRALGLT